MKPRSNCKITIVILAAALLCCANYAQAGSKEPNPAALAKAAAASSEASRVVESDMHMLLTRLAKGDEFTKKFDQATYKKDRKELARLIKEAGIRQSTITVEGVESDMKITLKCCFKVVCVSLTIEW